MLKSKNKLVLKTFCKRMIAESLKGQLHLTMLTNSLITLHFENNKTTKQQVQQVHCFTR